MRENPKLNVLREGQELPVDIFGKYYRAVYNGDGQYYLRDQGFWITKDENGNWLRHDDGVEYPLTEEMFEAS